MLVGPFSLTFKKKKKKTIFVTDLEALVSEREARSTGGGREALVESEKAEGRRRRGAG